MTDVNLEDLYQMFYEDPDFSGGLGGNPNDSKEEAAWEEAQSRFKQHKNNEKALKVGINQNKADEAKDDRKKFIRRKLLRKQQNPFAIATAKAKEMGYSDFSEGSEGDKKRGEIAEAIKERKMQKQSWQTSGIPANLSPGAAAAKEKGLVPQSGNWQHPGKWVKPIRGREYLPGEKDKHGKVVKPVGSSKLTRPQLTYNPETEEWESPLDKPKRGKVKKAFGFGGSKKKGGSEWKQPKPVKFTTSSPSKSPSHTQPGKMPGIVKQYEDLEEEYDKKPVRRGDPDSQRGDVGHDTRRKKDTDKSKKGIKKEDNYTDKLSRNFPNVDEYDVTNEDAVKQHKEKKDMDTAEMVVNGVMKDLMRKGIINSKSLEKAGILELSKDMSIPAIAGLLGAGAMLAKVFKLEDDNNADDDEIEKQVVDYMGKNGDFFEGVASMCDFICRTKDGEEEGDGSRGNRIMEAASEFHKQCGGGAAGPSVFGE